MGYFPPLQVANLVFEVGGVFQVEAKILLKCDLPVEPAIHTDLPECIIACNPFGVRGRNSAVLLLCVCRVLIQLGLRVDRAF